MRSINSVFILLLFPFFLMGETIQVALPLDQPLLPLYLSHFSAKESDLNADYLQKLDTVLLFDLNHNGMTEAVATNSKLEKIALPPIWNTQPALKEWRDKGILYVVVPKIEGKTASFHLLSTTNEGVKLLDGISLTGNLAEDRQKLHKVADTIYFSLFGKEGIASRRFIFTRKVRTDKGASHSYLVESDFDGANQQVLFESNHLIVTPCLIPAKANYQPKSCLYVSYELGQPKIFISSLEGKGRKRVTYLKGNQLTPAISPDRDRIAFINDSLGNPDLFLLEFSEEGASAEPPRRIYTFPKSTNASPSFSPDGKSVAFVSSKDGATRIYVLKIPEKGATIGNLKPQLLTMHQREASAPCWSPDGTKIAYCAKGVEPERQIWIYDLEKKAERQLTFGPGDKENPTFAPNSLHLIFNVRRGDESSELYLMNLNQTEALPIVTGPGQNRFPSW